ncbi:MAG: 2-hydroxychromene-2-carboxylate isomerase [Alphaproteobacteria bacterium]|nr:2-hydroxychromene-2-carboxylate isomerase [Alphaproteobacteria bacterium]MDP6830712.1 2-hydroxychromene-2-carboxylate isomerase [Alphaproteobacteria bacterium]MDP6874422.1 2-hydroxychromene-2-carboxylate isomerase [Alphaproteobacteria bacterium]
MVPSFEFHFDFGSPNAYFCHKVLPDLVQRTGVPCVYVPVLLGGVFKLTNNKSPMEQFQGIRNKNEYGQLEMARFVRKHALTAYTRNPHFPVNTVQIMRGAIWAKNQGNFEAYVDAVYRHMWEEGLKMDDPDVIRRALDEDGLDGAAMLEGIQDQSVKDELLNNTTASVERGTFGSPTFYVGDEIFFGKDRLAEIEAEIEHQK